MINIRGVRDKLTKINLKRYNILLNERMFRRIIKIAPNLTELRAGPISAHIHLLSRFNQLELLTIKLMKDFEFPMVTHFTKVKRLEITNETRRAFPLLKLLDSFVNIEQLVIIKSTIDVDVINEIKKHPLKSLSFIFCKEELEEDINILKEIPSLEALSILNLDHTRQNLLRGVTKHCKTGTHRLESFNYLVHPEEQDIVYFRDNNPFPIQDITVCFLTSERYDPNEFLDLMYSYPWNFDLTFRELRHMNNNQKDIDHMKMLFGFASYKRPLTKLIFGE